jgi:ATP-dependent protease HslVU (ClpYQ) peptidase subunit
MTCIAAKVNKQKVVFAWESAVTQGECLVVDLTPKVVTIGCWGPVGGSGSASAIAAGLNIFSTTSSLEKLVERIYKECSEEGEEIKTDWLLFHNGGLVTIDNMGSCVRLQSPFWAIGSGSWLALGAMEAGASSKRAVEIACKHHNGCSPPVQVLEWGPTTPSKRY